MRVLLIGLYAPLVKALKQGLEEEGVTVVVHTDDPQRDGELAVTDCDAIVLDQIRPGTTGLARLRRCGLRSPALVLTPTNDTNATAASPDWGIADWLTKPFEWDVFSTRLRALVHRSDPSVPCLSPHC
jgi:DNA-binding response OmpR family regulator